MRQRKILSAVLWIGSLLAFVGAAAAQDALTNPPNLAPAGGLTATGSYSLSKIESVNTGNGNVTLRFPLGSLPPSPGGFSGGVSLMYNSGIYDAPAAPYDSTHSVMGYQGSTHGGGWTYGYKYTLWAQPKISPYNQASCAYFSGSELLIWYKNFLRTPDGSNHALYVVSPTDFIQGDAYWYAAGDFSGNGNPGCGQNVTPYQGTIVFVTGDGSYIRVEADTVHQTWVAYLPDGTQVGGPIATVPAASSPTGKPFATDSPNNLVTDRNGNTLSIVPLCQPGFACTEQLKDAQGRIVSVNYIAGGGGYTWNDTITSQGINGPLTATVNWAGNGVPAQPFSYYCRVASDGTTVQSNPCTISSYPLQVSSVQLPPATNGGPGVNFTFDYTALPSQGAQQGWGEVHTMVECVGISPTSCQPEWSAYYGYSFDTVASTVRPPGTTINPIASKQLSYRELRDGSTSTPVTEITGYSFQSPQSPFTPNTPGPLTTPTVITYPDNSQTTIYLTNPCTSSTVVRDACSPVPYKTINPDLSTTEVGWISSGTVPTGIPAGEVFNPFVQWTVQTPAGSSVSKGSQAQRDANGNVTSITEYDWMPAGNIQRTNGIVSGISCSGSCLSRTTTSSYYSSSYFYWNQGSPLNFRAKQTVSVSLQGAAATQLVQYSYDNALTTANLTQVTQSDSVQGNIVSSSNYATHGNIQSQTDPNGVKTLFCYDSNNLYPLTRVIAAQTGASCPNPAELPEGQKTTLVTDFGSGLVQSQTDVDNSISTTYTYDNLGRQIRAQQTGTGLTRSSSTTFDDVNQVVTTTQDDTSSQQLVSTTEFDALGRVRYAVDGAGNQIQKAYRFGSGVSYELSSNPYLSISDTTMGWTLTSTNVATRTTTVQHFAGSNAPGGLTTPPSYGTYNISPPAAWGSNTVTTGTTSAAYDQTTSGCPGTTTNLTDEANNTHLNCYDGLGRLTAVTEPDPNSGLPGVVTSYTYDQLNNLIGVSVSGQPNSTCSAGGVGQTRCFTYSSLGRLVSATNPESGTTLYQQYDSNGNLLQQKDAQGTIIAMGYDALNRLKSKNYTPGGAALATATATYEYDQDFKGALSLVSTTGSNTSYTHDGFGRVNSSTQTTTTGTQPTSYQFSYGYSLTDQLTQITYPSGRTISYGLDAADRVNLVKNVGMGTNYASNIQYTAASGISSMTMGNGVAQQLAWNDRAQPTSLQVTSTNNPPSNALLTLQFYPCPSQGTSCTTGNNGNLQSQAITQPGLSLTQNYSYDKLNRLTAATESGSQPWTESYNYDANGNRWVPTHTSPPLPALSLETPIAQSWYSNSSIPNRINTWSYDAVGNVLGVGGMTRTFTYDAENRQVGATVNSATATYTYDGKGLRVTKTSGGNTTVYVYDAFGYLAAEYSSQAATSACDTNTCYAILDHLGSTRMLTDANGSSSVTRYDYLPFGQELLASTNGRTTGMGYLASADGSNPKFTGKNRDGETFLDWFEVRYMSGAQGRFQSVDPGNAGANPSDPQTWNMYAYVNNNPLSYTDPSGMGFWSDLANFALNLGLDVLTGGVNQWLGGVQIGPPSIGSISGCGGPLGNCGTLNNDPWSENSQLGNVQDPGRFVMDLQPADKNTPWQALYWLTWDPIPGIRGKGQSFKGCMSEHANQYSAAGFASAGISAASGRNVPGAVDSAGQFFYGNVINTLAFGSFGDATATGAQNAPTLIGFSMKAPLTFGRRTSEIMALNLAGKGGLPKALSQASKGAQGALGTIGKAVGGGISFTTSMIMSAGFTLGEALNCSH